MMRIVQTYHGTGSYEGYKYVLEKYIPELFKYIEIGEFLLNEFKNGYKSDYNEKNILKIEKILERRNKREKTKLEKERLWYKLAIQDREIKKVWEEKGAYFIDKGSYVKWYYKDEMFYLWWSGTHVEEENPKLLKADEKFKELLLKYNS